LCRLQPKTGDVETLFSKGQEKEILEEYEDAIVIYTAVIEIEPDNAFAYYCRGTTRFYNFEDKDGARADLEKAIELDYPVSQEDIALIFN
jgi:tetratricopeptide (TPR) repeat protein